jgi:hypothetical protein
VFHARFGARSEEFAVHVAGGRSRLLLAVCATIADKIASGSCRSTQM